VEDDLFLELRDIISTYKNVSYDAARYILNISDIDPNNSNNVILVYNRASVSGTWDNGITWNREHIWPQSLLDGASVSDLHNLKPADTSINSSRGNKTFENSTSGTYGAVGSGWYPGDDDRGDIARIVFYMVTRYPQLDIETLGTLAMFLEWHEVDPVDDFERNRNEVIYSNQENRNPFIDYPHFVNLIWGNKTTSSYNSNFLNEFNIMMTYLEEEPINLFDFSVLDEYEVNKSNYIEFNNNKKEGHSRI
jgi:endonuclease I